MATQPPYVGTVFNVSRCSIYYPDLACRPLGTGKSHVAFDLFGALAVCDEYRVEVLKFVNFLERVPLGAKHAILPLDAIPG